MALEGFRTLAFAPYHRDELPRAVSEGRGQIASRALGSLGSLAFRLPNGAAWTYEPRGETVALIEGDTSAKTVITLEHEAWEGLVHDYESVPGLLYSSRVTCVRGDAYQLLLWEPALRALYQGRPVYDCDEALLDRNGCALDTARVFRTTDDTDEMSHFLRTTGYLIVRRVFDKEHAATLLREAHELREAAVPGDGGSWWAKDGGGKDVLCRITRSMSKPGLAALFGDPRIERLAQLAEPDAVAAFGEGDGVTLIYKNPGISDGLSDLPWHRDCGHGGHAPMCPRIIGSVYVSAANPGTGDLVFLPGSVKSSCGYMDPDVLPMRAVRVRAEPGDVTIHYGDVMHAAPPPTRNDLAEYRVSAVLDFSRPNIRIHRGAQSYNEQLHARGDGRVEHLGAVVRRARKWGQSVFSPVSLAGQGEPIVLRGGGS